MYESPEELLREIQAGEDSLLEWKEVVFKGAQLRFVATGEHAKASVEMAKDLTGFANSAGGVIVFGVRKDGERVGVPPERMELLRQFIVNVAQNNVEPPMGHLLIFDNVMLTDSALQPRLCLRLEIRRARFDVHAPKGRRPYHRLGDRCHEMTLDQQARAFERKGLMLPFEERPLTTVSADELDPVRFVEYCRVRYGDAPGIDRELLHRRMRNLKLLAPDELGRDRPTVLGTLLFNAEPSHHIPGAYVDVAAYGGLVPDANRQEDAKLFRGTVIEQIRATLDYLLGSPRLPTSATKDASGRLDRPSYPPRALQEAIVNSLVHRDYSLPSQVRVFLFDDRIEVTNPGALHNTLTPENLYDGCQPVRRNQMLAGFLRDFTSPLTQRSYMEARGEGFLTMVGECVKLSGRRPELQIIGGGVRLTLYRAG